MSDDDFANSDNDDEIIIGDDDYSPNFIGASSNSTDNQLFYLLIPSCSHK